MEDICTACLCTGRKMQFLYNTEYFNVFSQILNEALIYNPNMYLMKICWECRAVLRKVELFKQKVKLSHAELVNYQLQNDPKILTNHTSLKCESIFNIGCYEDDIKVENSSVFNINEDSIIDLPVAVDIKTEEHLEPESFVKDLCVKPEKKKDTKKKIDKQIKEKSKKKLNGNKKNKKESVKIRKKLKSTKNIVSKEIIDTDDIIEDDFDRTSDNYCDEEIKIEENVLENNEKYISDNKVTEVVKKVILKEDNHLEPRLPEKPVCVECGKIFSSKKTYRYHLNVLHKGQNRYPCPRCGKVYQWKSNLGRHMRSHKAMDSGELYCAMCDKRFASVATYRQHLRVSRRHVTESEFSFMCNECGKKFVNKTRLRDHIDWEHLKKIKFRCQLCNKPFKCHTSLYVHLQNVHRNKELKNNLCHVCGKSYQNAAKLKYHITAMHTSETPYQCVQCQASFGWYSSLYRHIKEVHHKVKMYQKPKKKCKKITLIAPQLPVLHEQGP